MKGETITLSDVATIFNGKTPSRIEQRTSGHPVLKIKDVDADGIFHGQFESFVEPGFTKKFEEKIIRRGDVLILNAAHNADYVASKIYHAEPSVVGAMATGEWLIARAIPGKLDSQYLYYWFTSSSGKHLLRDIVKGIHLYPKDVARLKIPLPPLPEQRRLAAILDAADALRAKRRAALGKLEALGRGVFWEMFGEMGRNTKGWPVVPLASCFARDREGTKCGPFGSALKRDEYVDSGIPVWTMENIQGLRFNPGKVLFITEQKYRQLANYGTVNGDIIISRAGTVGKMCVVETSEPKSIISTNLIRLSLDSQVLDPYYFVSLMTYGKGKVGRLETGPDGAYTFMNTGILEKLRIPVPAIEVQKGYREFWYRREEQAAKSLHHLAEMNRLFCSLQRGAFRGEL